VVGEELAAENESSAGGFLSLCGFLFANREEKFVFLSGLGRKFASFEIKN